MQILQDGPRQPEIFGFKSLRESIVDERELMKCLIPLSPFGEQTRQGRCRSQLQGQRGLDARDFDGFGQAIYGRYEAVPRHGRKNPRFDPQKFCHVVRRSALCRARDGAIDSEEGLLHLPGHAQALGQRSRKKREQDVELPGRQGLQRTP